MNAKFATHDGIRFAGDPGGHKGVFQETDFYEMLVNFLLFVFFLVLFFVL